MENKMAATQQGAMNIPGLNLVNEGIGLKRKLEDGDEDEEMKEEPVGSEGGQIMSKKTRRNKAKRRKTSLQPANKNPLMMLNEFKPGLEYKLEAQEGPAHNPTFVVSVTVDGEQYQGSGSSKQKAKQDAAEKALQSFVQLPFNIDTIKPEGDVDFTEDSTDAANKNIFRTFSENGKQANQQTIDNTKHPVMLLNELCGESKVDYQIEEEPTELGKFMCNIVVNGEEFSGAGDSKKKAKMAAAAHALMKIYSIEPQYKDASPKVVGGPVIEQPPETKLPQQTANHIAQLVQQKYKELTSNLGEQLAKRKVLAGIVMTTSNDSGIQQYDIISIGTGTKFISGEHINDKGYAVNDCHGEIIARRALRQFLYAQLEQAAGLNKQSSILERKRAGFFAVKQGIDFHLYISTSPCGDARVFSPHEVVQGECDAGSMSRKRGILRVKLENGEGTIPSANMGRTLQTWDGVIATEKLCTMSCSDKICKWNVVGLQGALLSNFMEPVYLKSIVLGSLYRYEHMARAMYERMGTLENLPPFYRQNQPAMNTVTAPESRKPGKAPRHSFNWCSVDPTLESVDGLKGKLLETSQPSRLCKQAMFVKFLGLWKKFKPRNKIPQMYVNAKEAAVSYQKAKDVMLQAFAKNEQGAWLGKPVEQDQFGIIAAQ